MTSLAQRPEKAVERPHPATPLIRGWIVFLVLIVAIGRQFLPDENGPDADPVTLLQRNLLVVIGILLLIVLLVALASFLTWWFTRYVVDDEELRIETGLLTKTSKRIPFQRIQSIDVIQPLAARIFGLAELRIDAGNDKTVLRYLTRRRAYRIRDYLLSRAHGEQITVADSAQRGEASAWRDLAAQDEVLVRLPPQRLIAGFVTSTGFLVSVVVSVAALAVMVTVGLGVFSIGALIPVALGTVRMIGSQLLTQFNYTLARTGRGLRITRGLTNLTSQSVPADRIQDVRVTQSFIWKWLGLYRVDIDVLGISGGDEEENATSGSLLLPVGNRRELDAALAAILPGVALQAMPLWRSPRRAWWLHWPAARTYVWGHDARVAYARHGLIENIANIVPHDKVQSVRISQGPVQRLLGVASVHLHTTRSGLNTWEASDIDTGDARRFALSELGRLRRARNNRTRSA